MFSSFDEGATDQPKCFARFTKRLSARLPNSRESFLSYLLREFASAMLFELREFGLRGGGQIENPFACQLAVLFVYVDANAFALVVDSRNDGRTASAEWIQYDIVHIAE